MRFRCAVLAAACMVPDSNAIRLDNMPNDGDIVDLSQTDNTTESKVEAEPLVSLLARHTKDSFEETGLTGASLSALLAGYDPLMTVPGAMTGFARARACDMDGKKMVLSLPIDERCPDITHPVTVRLGGDDINTAVKTLRQNPVAPILASALSKPACLDIKTKE